MGAGAHDDIFMTVYDGSLDWINSADLPRSWHSGLRSHRL